MSSKKFSKAILSTIAKIAGTIRGQIKPPEGINDSLQKFRKDYPNGTETAFIMMSFKDSAVNAEILNAIQTALQKNNIKGLRADAKEYHPQLYENVLTYIYGCSFGIAVFERIESDNFNPNVTFEVGYSFALGKEILLLKDRTLPTLPADLLARLYKPFDPHQPDKLISPHIDKWVEDHNQQDYDAREIKLGGAQTSELDPNELDFYILKVKAGQRFTVEGDAGRTGTRIDIYNSRADKIYPKWHGQGILDRGYFGGRYYGGVWDVQSAIADTYVICVSGSIGDYNITVTEGSHGVSRGNISIGQSTGDTLRRNEFHRWIVDLTSAVNQRVAIQLTTSTEDTWLELFDPENERITQTTAKHDANKNCSAEIIYDVQTPGKYMISVLNSTGAYKLAVSIHK